MNISFVTFFSSACHIDSFRFARIPPLFAHRMVQIENSWACDKQPAKTQSGSLYT